MKDWNWENRDFIIPLTAGCALGLGLLIGLFTGFSAALLDENANLNISRDLAGFLNDHGWQAAVTFVSIGIAAWFAYRNLVRVQDRRERRERRAVTAATFIEIRANLRHVEVLRKAIEHGVGPMRLDTRHDRLFRVPEQNVAALSAPLPEAASTVYSASGITIGIMQPELSTAIVGLYIGYDDMRARANKTLGQDVPCTIDVLEEIAEAIHPYIIAGKKHLKTIRKHIPSEFHEDVDKLSKQVDRSVEYFEAIVMWAMRTRNEARKAEAAEAQDRAGRIAANAMFPEKDARSDDDN